MSKRKRLIAGFVMLAFLAIVVVYIYSCYYDALYYSDGRGGSYTTEDGYAVHVYTGSKFFGIIADSVEVAGLIKIVVVTPKRVFTTLLQDKSVKFYYKPKIQFVESPDKLCSIVFEHTFIIGNSTHTQRFDVYRDGKVNKLKP